MAKRIIIFSVALALVIAVAVGVILTPTTLASEVNTDNGSISPGPGETAGAAIQTQSLTPGDAGPLQFLGAEPAAGVTLNAEDHIAYITGDGAGYFNPNDYMTRAQIAVILYRLLSETVPVTVSYTDVPENAWYADAAAQLGSMGVLRPGESTFEGSEYITRGEFAHCVAAFFPRRTDAVQFSDVPYGYEYADDILSCKAYGWLGGYTDGTFRPERLIQRCEAVSLVNHALGRTGDEVTIPAERPALFLDVPVNAWYYCDLMESTVPHSFTVTGAGAEMWTSFEKADTGLPAGFRTQGFHLYQGWSYYYDAEAGDICRNSTVYGFAFDADGHFTSGDAWVDQQLREIILSQTTSSMTRDEMLRAAFAYCRDHYKYLKWTIFATGDTSFTLDAARQILSTGRGNCYCYASTFWYLARWLGYDAKIFSGGVLGGPHSWVEIDGYIYDTQLEWRYVHDWGRTQYWWTFYHLRDSNDTFRYRK